MIRKDVQFYESKRWNWLKVSSNPMYSGENSSNVRIVLQKDQVKEVAREQDVIRSTRKKNQLG